MGDVIVFSDACVSEKISFQNGVPGKVFLNDIACRNAVEQRKKNCLFINQRNNINQSFFKRRGLCCNDNQFCRQSNFLRRKISA